MNRKATKTDTALCVMKTGCRCMYCGEKLSEGNFTVDHIDAWCKSKNSKLPNIAPCCDDCNNLKGSSSLEEFRSKLSKSILEKARADKKTASLLRLGVLKVDKDIKFYFEKIKPEMLDYIESLFDDPENFNVKYDKKQVKNNETTTEKMSVSTEPNVLVKSFKLFLASNSVTSGCLTLKKKGSQYVVYQKTKVGLEKEVGSLDSEFSCILKVPVKCVTGVSLPQHIWVPSIDKIPCDKLLMDLLDSVWYAINGKYCCNAISSECAPFTVNKWSIYGKDSTVDVYDNETFTHHFIECSCSEGDDYKWHYGEKSLEEVNGKSLVQLLKFINGSTYLNEVFKNG